MSNFDEQMRLFEQSVGGAAQAPSAQHFMNRGPPSFMPSSVRQGMPRGQIPPPPSYPRPQYIHPTTAMPGVTPLSKTVAAAPQKEYSAAPVISKAPAKGGDDDDDIMATLMKYEKEVKTDKKRKPDNQKPGEAGGSGPKMMKPSSVIQPSRPPPPKPGTQVTPDEIKKKAKQMVEAVKASQVTQTKVVPGKAGAKGESKGKKHKKMIRMAGGQMWEDASLLAWDPNDFRLFCGDLGNDVTDEVLTRTFSKYTSFQQAKVVRDKRSNKTKGYGFVSFRDPADFTKAIKEMDGKYVGSRPIKLRKSNWKDRNIDQVKGKQKKQQTMGYKQN